FTSGASRLDFRIHRVDTQLSAPRRGTSVANGAQGVWVMISVRRLMVVGTALSLAAALTCSHVWGVPGEGKAKGPDKGKPAELLGRRFAEDVAVSRFTEQPVHVYQKGAKGEALFSLLVKPKLPDAPARPRDVLVLVDTSASKAQGPLA